ncbi:hypothetical protein [Hymenobacter jeollabukensis]|uniref:Uncharacterized protein n=1 Tax=Hymenobacter jeollabukensis TaxID=2025313 RepID=A0A5R8WRH6_9BACT|nr:hypothetical protein [Hymenobacter jeollabukensis]TLM93347.1 hypothetical protein FDY95_12090 [Hymenobacter jeollabukensis]
MLRKLFIILVILWSASQNAHAQRRAERKALRVFCHRILPNVNAEHFYPHHRAAPICYDGTVAPQCVGDWWLDPTWYKDVRGRSRFHPQMRDFSVYRSVARRIRITN